MPHAPMAKPESDPAEGWFFGKGPTTGVARQSAAASLATEQSEGWSKQNDRNAGAFEGTRRFMAPAFLLS
tara:strand:- start:321 stop:530 length:210 start_codon:yes stop_codon:yes gene_type:complete